VTYISILSESVCDPSIHIASFFPSCHCYSHWFFMDNVFFPLLKEVHVLQRIYPVDIRASVSNMKKEGHFFFPFLLVTVEL
jgi:hypothetical protein